MKKLFIHIILSLSVFLIKAQDLHFSQFYSVPVLVNPAEAGRLKEDSRFTFIHRTQWASLNSKFNSTGISTDFVVMPSFMKRDNLGLGVYAVNDNIGSGVFKSSSVYISLAYHTFLDRVKRHRLSGGLQAGYTSKAVDNTYFQFYNQYQDFAFVPDKASGENLNGFNYHYFDGQAGLYYTYLISQKTELNAGTSLYQLHQPKESVLTPLDSTKNKLGTRTINTLGLKYKLSDKFSVNPQMLYMRQSRATDVNIGSLAIYTLNSEAPINLVGGVFYRTSDALIFLAGIRYKSLEIRYSYDMTMSSAKKMRGALNATNKPVNAHEFVLNFYGKLARKNSRDYTLPCTIF